MTTPDRAADVAEPDAYFETDGDLFVPTPLAQGPWGASINGMYVGGILGHVIERDAAEPEFQPTRLTVDLLRPVGLTPLAARTRIARAGRRLRLVDAELTQGGVVVARASALFLRRGVQPADQMWTTPVTMPELPTPPDRPYRGNMIFWAFGADTTAVTPSFDLSNWQHAGPRYAWLREVNELVGGEPLTPFTRVAMAGDVASSLTHTSASGLMFINADYTITMSRLPDGPDLGLAALTHYSHDGVATGSATVVDHRGPIGTAVATALVNPGFDPPKLA